MGMGSVKLASCFLCLLTLLFSQGMAACCWTSTSACRAAPDPHPISAPDSCEASSCCGSSAVPETGGCCDETPLTCERCTGFSGQNPALLLSSPNASVLLLLTASYPGPACIGTKPPASPRDPLIDQADTYLYCRVLLI
jgi:hypothetical protein